MTAPFRGHNFLAIYSFYRDTVSMKIFKYIIALSLTALFFTDCSKTDRELLMEKLNYENRKFSFSLKFPETWSKYNVMERIFLIDDSLEVYGIYFILPTRSRDWQPVDTPEKSAVLFKILVFKDDEWKYYRDNYIEKRGTFKLTGRVLGKREGKVYFVNFSDSVPVDLYIYIRESEKVISTFRLTE